MNITEVSGNASELGVSIGNVGGGAPGTYVPTSNPNAVDTANCTEPGPKLGSGGANAPYQHPTSEMTPIRR